MSTRAEKVRAARERKGPRPKKARKLAQRKPKVHHEPVRVAKNKAAYAKEDTAPGQRPSRKSTRTDSNRIKHDTNKARQSTRAVRSPKQRAAKAAGRRARPRSGSAA
jgi:hypothetical protein